MVDRLGAPVAEAHAAVGGSEEVIGLEYRPAGEGSLREAYEQAAERERRQGQTVVGPHRDDVKITLNQLVAGDFGSEGQQRTLALALKLGQGRLLGAERDREPIYLIDDIFGELDPGRRNRLMESLPAGAQKLITTTSLDWLEGLAPAVFEVVAGRIASAEG